MGYKSRFVDEELKSRLRHAGAVLIEGCKGCGKTETGSQFASSIIRYDADEEVKLLMAVDARASLRGEVPRLLDEWQVYPQVWDYVRREVDTRKKKGQFILTGSATPEEDTKRHSGVGRFSVLKMRPMSLFEMGWSSGEVSLHSIAEYDGVISSPVDFNLKDFAEKMILGGWPALINQPLRSGIRYARDYIALTSEVDLSRVSNKRRDPIKVRRVLQSIARNVATEVTLATLAKDSGDEENKLNKDTVADYVTALERLMILESQPAWSTHIRSSDTLRKMPKRHFVDPSLAVGALGLSIDKLVKDLHYYGFLFESLVMRDLRIYAEMQDASIYHYRDSRGMEVDAIVEYLDGAWMAIEVKLGIGAVEDAAENLLKFVAKVDTEKVGEPKALIVITGNGFAHKRPDGVYVVPISTLTA